MNPEKLKTLLTEVEQGRTSIDDALVVLRRLPFEDLGFAKIDFHRQLRQGFPEVIFCQGKTVDQVVEITKRLLEADQPLLATRATVEMLSLIHISEPTRPY